MIKVPNLIIDELHKIREDNYNSTKDLTDEESIERTNTVAHVLAKEYGFCCISPKKSPPEETAA